MTNSTQEQIYLEAFKLFDINQNGHISKEELKEVLSQFLQNPTDEEISDIIKEYDFKDNGVVEFDEFTQLMNCTNLSPNLDNQLVNSDLHAAFNAFDIDKSGFINKSELKDAMKKLGESLTDEEIEILCSEIDINKDGRICFDEFMQIMQN